MDYLNFTRNICDFGIVMVVWLAQVIIYPSFAHIGEDIFLIWHKKYTRRIAFFVIPLLSGQAIILSIQIYNGGSSLPVISALVVALCWSSTFGLSVPCHARLQCSGKELSVIRRLVWTNLIRTLLWTFVFVLGLWQTFVH